MREETGDLWTKHAQGKWVAITTNGSLNKFGLAVMGAGVAKEAVKRHPELPRKLGAALTAFAKTQNLDGRDMLPVIPFPDLRIFAFPVKWEWHEIAETRLIVTSCEKLLAQLDTLAIPEVYLVRPGCGNGKLDWPTVRSLIVPILDDRVVIIEKKRN